MARQFKSVWDALEISYDTFVQTSEPRHHHCARTFIQKVYDAGYIRKDKFEGWYCEGCEAFKTEKDAKEGKGACPLHPNTPLIRRSEPCYYFELSKFEDRLLKLYEEHPDFIQPESRRNEMVELIRTEGLKDVNITRLGEAWGIRVPWDEEFTIYVWFDALLTYITGIGYGSDDAMFRKWWPADVHFIGKDITRFHCALWPAMLWAAGEEPPRMVFGHGFVYKKNEETGAVERFSKSLGNVVEPMDIVTKFSAEAFRYYFLRECPFPSDGEFSWSRFSTVYNSELANNLGNLLSRCLTLISKNFAGVLDGTAGWKPGVPSVEQYGINELDQELTTEAKPGLAISVGLLIESCRYNIALQAIIESLLNPANEYLEKNAPWKLVKSDKEAAKQVLFNAVQSLRVAAILLKPFIPRSAEAIYTSFNFPTPWAEVKYADAAKLMTQPDDLRVTTALVDGKPKPLFPRIE
jgi:methionyl-tRNA synthetase